MLAWRKTQSGCWPHSATHFLVLLSLTVRIGHSVPCLTFQFITKQTLLTGHLGKDATPMLSILCLVSFLYWLLQTSFCKENIWGENSLQLGLMFWLCHDLFCFHNYLVSVQMAVFEIMLPKGQLCLTTVVHILNFELGSAFKWFATLVLND